MPRTIKHTMRIVKKEFPVYNYSELTPEAQQRVRDWYTNNDSYVEMVKDDATLEGIATAKELLMDDEDISLEWDACSKRSVRDLTIFINEMVVEYDDNKHIYQEVATRIQDVMNWWYVVETIENEIIDDEVEFTKYGKFYKD